MEIDLLSPQPISASQADWSREKALLTPWRPWMSLLKAIRGYQRSRLYPFPFSRILAKYHVLRWHFWSAVCGTDIPLNSHIAGGLMIPHPNGIVIHPDAIIGPNCLLFQQVTIGNGGPISGTPRIGGHVDIGAGAKILGGVTIGDHAKIGANAVVITDVPPHATAVGIPARIIPHATTTSSDLATAASTATVSPLATPTLATSALVSTPADTL